MNQAARHGRRHQGADVAAASRGAEQEDLVRIAAERRDVGVEPAQHRDLIETAVVA